MPLTPKMLDYANAQVLLIGHEGDGLEKATVEQAEDAKQDKDTPLEEMEKLEHEDELRIEHLKGSDSFSVSPVLSFDFVFLFDQKWHYYEANARDS